jgi:steroid delta-isomerase-like uncharacterized protein
MFICLNASRILQIIFQEEKYMNKNSSKSLLKIFTLLLIIFSIVIPVWFGCKRLPVNAEAEKNKAAIHRHVEELFNKGDLSKVNEIIADNYICHLTDGTDLKGIEGFNQIIAMTRNAFPDIHYTIEDMVAEGDCVAVRYSAQGTQSGNLMGIPPTGKRITWAEAVFYRLKDGKEVEVYVYEDSLVMLRQLGIPLH